jgi:hypothetical protein
METPEIDAESPSSQSAQSAPTRVKRIYLLETADNIVPSHRMLQKRPNGFGRLCKTASSDSKRCSR